MGDDRQVFLLTQNLRWSPFWMNNTRHVPPPDSSCFHHSQFQHIPTFHSLNAVASLLKHTSVAMFEAFSKEGESFDDRIS